MKLPFLSKRSVEPVVFALGKMGGHPEFLRSPDALAATLDQWLDAGWQAALALHGASWAEAFEVGPTYGFLWAHGSKVDEVTYGVVAPSADSIGRRYPLLIGCRVPAKLVATDWAVAPVATVGFLDEAYAVIAEAQQNLLLVGDLPARLAQMRIPGEDESSAAARDREAWASETPLSEIWGTLFPETERPIEAASAAIEGLVECVRPFVGQEWPLTALVIRLPIGSAGPLGVAFWLALLRAATRWRATVPSVFWAAEGDGLILSIGTPTAACLGELWKTNSASEQVYDATKPSERLESGGAATRFLELHPDATMAELERYIAS